MIIPMPGDGCGCCGPSPFCCAPKHYPLILHGKFTGLLGPCLAWAEGKIFDMVFNAIIGNRWDGSTTVPVPCADYAPPPGCTQCEGQVGGEVFCFGNQLVFAGGLGVFCTDLRLELCSETAVNAIDPTLLVPLGCPSRPVNVSVTVAFISHAIPPACCAPSGWSATLTVFE